MRFLLGSYVAAAVFWFILFSPWTAPQEHFWSAMTAATGLLALFAAASAPDALLLLLQWKPRWLVVGVASAAVLYAVFLLGGFLSTRLFSFAARDIAGVYALKAQVSPYAIAAAILLCIAPAEEIFWRGLIQRLAQRRLGDAKGWLAAALMYAAVHVCTLNFTLVAAALVCGLFWGWMFLRLRSLWPGIISHALWDLAIFVLFPVTG